MHDRLARYAGQQVGLRVRAVDENGATNANVVWLRMEPAKEAAPETTLTAQDARPGRS